MSEADHVRALPPAAPPSLQASPTSLRFVQPWAAVKGGCGPVAGQQQGLGGAGVQLNAAPHRGHSPPLPCKSVCCSPMGTTVRSSVTALARWAAALGARWSSSSGGSSCGGGSGGSMAWVAGRLPAQRYPLARLPLTAACLTPSVPLHWPAPQVLAAKAKKGNAVLFHSIKPSGGWLAERHGAWLGADDTRQLAGARARCSRAASPKPASHWAGLGLGH